MDNNRNELEQPAATEESSVKAAGSVQSTRRKLLRAGLKASPVVVATLAARPSLACHCIVPSAWGSISTGMGGPQETGNLLGANQLTGSLTRFGGAISAFNELPHISAFASSGGQGWVKLRDKIKADGKNTTFYPAKLFNDLKNPTETDKQNRRLAYLQGLYANDANGVSRLRVSDLCSKLGFAVPVGTGSSTPISAAGSGGFGAAVLIAQINMYVYPGVVPSTCASKTTLVSMAMLTYRPQGSTQPWTREQIADYLHYNWIARR